MEQLLPLPLIEAPVSLAGGPSASVQQLEYRVWGLGIFLFVFELCMCFLSFLPPIDALAAAAGAAGLCEAERAPAMHSSSDWGRWLLERVPLLWGCMRGQGAANSCREGPFSPRGLGARRPQKARQAAVCCGQRLGAAQRACGRQH